MKVVTSQKLKRNFGLTRDPEVCPFCKNSNIMKRGKRAKKHEAIQRFWCRDCEQSFTGSTLNGKQFPTSMIIEALSLYNMGFSAEQVAQKIKDPYKAKVSKRTVNRWIEDFAQFCPFLRLRFEAVRRVDPTQAVSEYLLEHQQPYLLRVHRAKLSLILETRENYQFYFLQEPIENSGQECPHELFLEPKKKRASQSKKIVSREGLYVEKKINFAVTASKFVIQTVTRNTDRHEAIQRFLLYNDSVTVCTEFPIVLFQEDLDHFRHHGLELDPSVSGTLTGHIDIVQIRNGKVHILDYKPGAESVDAVDQLLIYALAFSRMTGLEISDISCGWFDHEAYFEFRPLHLFKSHGQVSLPMSKGA